MTSSAYQAWKEQYQNESGKLIDALGKAIPGGLLAENRQALGNLYAGGESEMV